jgi:hypothetical protein
MIIERPHQARGRSYQSIWPVPQVFFLKPAAAPNGGSARVLQNSSITYDLVRD